MIAGANSIVRKAEEKIKIKKARRLVIVFIGALLFILLLAYVLLKVLRPDFGPNISINYYVTLAGILPVLLVALFLTQTSRKLKNKIKSGWWLMLNEGKTEGLVGFTIGEIACLAAIATNQSMTSLFVASVFGLLVMIMIVFERIIYGDVKSGVQ